jgi:hypothetical protein
MMMMQCMHGNRMATSAGWTALWESFMNLHESFMNLHAATSHYYMGFTNLFELLMGRAGIA